MKIACAEALAALAREDVPDEVALAYGKKLSFGVIILSPHRLIHVSFMSSRPPLPKPEWTPASRVALSSI